MIITLSGMPGAGKSTVQRIIAERLNLKSYSIGDLRGRMAQEKGMTIDEFNALGMTDASTDKDVDEYQKHLGETEDNFIIDGLLAWHFIPHSTKIFLTIQPQTAAERIFRARRLEKDRDDEPLYTSVENAKAVIAARMAQNTERYMKWYGLNPLLSEHYDHIIDTTNLRPEEIAEEIIARVS